MLLVCHVEKFQKTHMYLCMVFTTISENSVWTWTDKKNVGSVFNDTWQDLAKILLGECRLFIHSIFRTVSFSLEKF